jgi:hypothetical protein
MLLRRVMDHFKEQNWFAVALDLGIVVLGIFLGFQVTAWNEARKERVAELAALHRLQAESEQVVAYWRMEVQQQARHNEKRRLLLEVLDEGAIAPDEQAAVDDAVMRLGHYPQFNPPRSVYDDLIGAGGLSTISDPEVRAAVAAYAAELDFVNGQLTQFRTSLRDLYDAYEGRVFSTYAPEKSSLRRYEYDMAALSGDRQFVSDIVDAVRNQLQFLTVRESILGRATSMCEALSRRLSTTCDAPAIDEDEIRARDGVNR